MWYYWRCCYLCLIPWLGIRSNMIYIQTWYCWNTIQRKVHSGIINLFDEKIVYSPDKDAVCSKRRTTDYRFEFCLKNMWNCSLSQQILSHSFYDWKLCDLLADLLLCSYQSEFLQKHVKDKRIHEARAFNFTYRYIDDVLSTGF
jgi:hypothetical protein